MSDKGEADLIALVQSEQRSFKRIVFAGLATLIVLVGMSAGLGVYYFDVSQRLAESALELQRHAFKSRRDLDAQNNRLAAQEARMRRIDVEILGAADARALSPAQTGSALAIARAYLESGRLSLADERVLDAAARTGDAGGLALVRGVAALVAWDRGGEALDGEAASLPPLLASAKAEFASAEADPALAPHAKAGAANIDFLKAQASNYARADCDAAIAAARAAPGPQPLYWQAQCERKMGETLAALADYARTLELARASPLDNDAARTLAMNAFHGVGTTLIAAADAPAGDANLVVAMRIAEAACAPDGADKSSERMRLALACLHQAIALRRTLRQTENQISGSSENLSFAYLRDGDFSTAFDHAQKVERSGLFAWTELVRALSSQHVDTPGASRVGAEARRNISFFTVAQFNLCELRVLLNEALYEEARAIIAREHRGETVDCPAPT